MPILFVSDSNGYIYPLRSDTSGRLYVVPSGWFSGSANLHTDSDGDLYVRPADWFSGSATLHTDASGNLFANISESLNGAAKLHLDADGDLYVRPADWFTGAATLHLDADGDLYVRPADWFSGAATLHTDADGDLYVRPADWFSGAAAQLLDASGRTIVKNTGLVGGAQQADPIRFGYSAPILRSADQLSIPTATYTLSDSAVPAGEIWVLTSVCGIYNGTPPTRIQIQINDGSSDFLIFRQLAPVSLTGYDRQGWWVLAPGYSLNINVTGATVGDDLFLRAQGFRVDIDQ